VTQERLGTLTHAMIARGTSPGVAEIRALAVLDAAVRRQAMMLSFERIFQLFGTAFLLALPLLLLMKWYRSGRRESVEAH